MASIQNQIQGVIHQLQIARKAKSREDELTAEIFELDKEAAVLHKRLSKELNDFEILQKNGLRNMFHKILGNGEQQLEKERQEYLKASYDYNEMIKSIELLEFELSVLKPKAVKIPKLEKSLDQLKRERETEILHKDPALAKQLRENSDATDQLLHFEAELIEALEAGEKCRMLLKNLIRYLRQVEHWGNGHRTSLQRMSIENNMNRARITSVNLKHALHRFHSELSDVGFQKLFIKYQLGNFNNFGEVFFGGLLSDWIFRNKLRNSINQCSSYFEYVSLVMKQIQHQVGKQKDKINKLEAKRDELLMS